MRQHMQPKLTAGLPSTLPLLEHFPQLCQVGLLAALVMVLGEGCKRVRSRSALCQVQYASGVAAIHGFYACPSCSADTAARYPGATY